MSKLLQAVFFDLRPEKPPIPLDHDAIIAGWKESRPAFLSVTPTIDSDQVQARAIRICRAIADETSEAVDLARSVETRAIDFARLAGEWLHRGEVRSEGFSSDLLTAVLRFAILPEWCAVSNRYLDGVSPDLWTGKFCPCCGGPPLLAEERGLERVRFLRCGFCASDRRVGRATCPTCGEEDASRIVYRFAEHEREKMRLLTCETCGDQVRIISSLDRLTPARLIAAELETLHLEWIGDVLPTDSETSSSA